MNRRRFLRRAGAGVAGAALLAGCTGSNGDDTETDAEGTNTDTKTAATTSAETSKTAGTPGTAETSQPTGTSQTDETATTRATTDTPGTTSPTANASTDDSTTSTDKSTPSANATVGSAATNGTPSGTLTVATYSSFTGEDTAGTWLKSAFEDAYPETTVEFRVPENGLNQYIQRAKQGAPIDADLYVGLNTGELVRADEQLDDSLFATADDIEGADGVKDALEIDPDGRAIPYDTGYITSVYNGKKIDAPKSFDALLEPDYENALITENAQQSDPGRAFLLWTILEKGEDGYLDYWKQLLDNGVQVLSDWQPAYDAFTNGEAPMVVSYSTDQVYYHKNDTQLAKHKIAFLNQQAYANPEAMALFDGSDNAALGRRFMEFVLTEKAQSQVAVKNVEFPAVEGIDPGGEFSKYAVEPPDPVTMSYDDLSGKVGDWIDAWARQVSQSG